jgi:hypothetical protein
MMFSSVKRRGRRDRKIVQIFEKLLFEKELDFPE